MNKFILISFIVYCMLAVILIKINAETTKSCAEMKKEFNRMATEPIKMEIKYLNEVKGVK